MDTSQYVLTETKAAGIVPLFTPETKEEATFVIDAAYTAGIRVFEMTNRRPDSFDIFRSLVGIKAKYAGLQLGIGTILDGETTRRFIDAGADFIISPVLNIDMADVCRERNVMWIPGCATLTEIVTAKDHGAALIKLFPGSVLGPSFVSSILPVVPDLKLMITGGVEPTEQNLAEWFKAGAWCVGMGTHLFPRNLIAQKSWRDVSTKISEAIRIASKVRS